MAVRAMSSDGTASAPRPGEELSVLDRRIVDHLQADGRKPFTQIAAELGVSEAAVRARTNRLLERGVIQIVGLTDPVKLGFQQQAMIGVRCEGGQMLAVAEAVAEFSEVSSVVVTAGAFDLLVEVVCEDGDALLGFLTDKLRTVGGVRDTETFVYLRTVKQLHHWRAG